MGNLRNDFPTYIGTSIKNSEEELEKLKKLGLPIFFYDHPEGYYDEVEALLKEVQYDIMKLAVTMELIKEE